MSRSYIWQASQPTYGKHLDAALRARDEGLRAIIRAIGATYGAWLRRRRRIAALRDLEALDDRLLDDINLTRGGIRQAVDGMLERKD